MGIKDGRAFINPLKELPEADLDMSQAGRSRWVGNCIGIDMSGFLHMGILSCATELCTDQAEQESRHKNYVTSKLMALVAAGWRPVAVFDGAEWPLKGGENNKRAKGKEHHLHEGQVFLPPCIRIPSPAPTHQHLPS